MAQEGADAVFVGDEPEHLTHIRLIAELAEKARLPSVYAWREGVQAGGLMAYAFEILDLIRRNADIIAKILAGAKPGDIPFYEALKFELSFNLKTAKALGIEIPGFLLAVADEGSTDRSVRSVLGHKRSLVGQGDRNMLLGIFAHVEAVPLN
jgi:putative ABC transport system substrate-binding protein